jgi:hypothetical protein
VNAVQQEEARTMERRQGEEEPNRIQKTVKRHKEAVGREEDKKERGNAAGDQTENSTNEKSKKVRHCKKKTLVHVLRRGLLVKRSLLDELWGLEGCREWTVCRKVK